MYNKTVYLFSRNACWVLRGALYSVFEREERFRATHSTHIRNKNKSSKCMCRAQRSFTSKINWPLADVMHLFYVLFFLCVDDMTYGWV